MKRRTLICSIVACCALLPFGMAQSATAQTTKDADPVTAVSYSDALDKIDYQGTRVGGLSGIAWDAQADSYVAQSDNHGSDASRVWFIGKDLSKPSITRDPVTLKNADGKTYNGNSTDNEGLAVLPNGDFAITSEGLPSAGSGQAEHPTIRIFGADGVQKNELKVPELFDINTHNGRAQHNLTLEGLSLSPSGHQLVAAMEGTLTSDVYQNKKNARRFLVYRDDVAGANGTWTLVKQVGFQALDNLDVTDVALESDDAMYVLQRTYSSSSGNRIALAYVSGLSDAADVTDVANLNDPANADKFVHARQLNELTNLPNLGAKKKPGSAQKNPLMDNYEGLVITNRSELASPDSPYYRGDAVPTAKISIISDDNYSAKQWTRILNVESRPYWQPADGFTDAASGTVSPYVEATGRDDRLDYWSVNGYTGTDGQNVKFGGLSSTVYSQKLGQYVSAMDNHGSDLARLWLLGNDLTKAAPTGSIVLKAADGTPYNGDTTDSEGLGVLPNGDFVLTSEGHPSADVQAGEHEQPKIRIFGTDGVQKSEIAVPELFDINGKGQAVHNKSLEALTVSPSGHQIIVGNEYALKNDSPTGKDIATPARRALVYRDDVKGAEGEWTLVKQIAFNTLSADYGITEFASVGEDGFLILQRSWDEQHGYGVQLAYAHGIAAAKDVSSVASLSTSPADTFLPVTQLADLSKAPTLGARLKPNAVDANVNPLLDNFEDLVVTNANDNGKLDLTVLSDNNFDTVTETTRIINLRIDRSVFVADPPTDNGGNNGNHNDTGGHDNNGQKPNNGSSNSQKPGNDAANTAKPLPNTGANLLPAGLTMVLLTGAGLALLARRKR